MGNIPLGEGEFFISTVRAVIGKAVEVRISFYWLNYYIKHCNIIYRRLTSVTNSIAK